MARRKTLTTFQLSFVGEYIEVLTNLVAPQGNEILPLAIQGYLLDRDDSYLYMGSTHAEIDRAIRNEEVKFIQIIEISNPLKEYLAQTPIPKDKDEGN